jgi:hypothetical protein
MSNYFQIFPYFIIVKYLTRKQFPEIYIYVKLWASWKKLGAGSWKASCKLEATGQRAGKIFQICKILGAGNYLTYFEIYVIIKGEI